MIELYKAAKEKFPTNVIVALILGIIIGYFLGTYVSGGASGEAFYPTQCEIRSKQCSGNTVQVCVRRSGDMGWRDQTDCTRNDRICQNGECVAKPTPAPQPIVSPSGPAQGIQSPTPDPAYSTTGTAKVYRINPTLTPNLETIQLRNLDGSGYLKGRYVQVVISSDSTLSPAYSQNNTFIYEPVLSGQTNYVPEGQHFDETALYYGFNYAAEFFDRLMIRTTFPIRVEFDSIIWGRRQCDAAEATGQINPDGTVLHIIRYGLSCPNSPIFGIRDIKYPSHEATHAIFEDSITNTNMINILRDGTEPTHFIINEGYAEYFSSVISTNPKGVFQDVLYDLDKDVINYTPPPAVVEQITPSLGSSPHQIRFKYPDDINNMYAFAGSLWNIKNKLGLDKTNRLIVESWKLMPIAIGRPDMVIDAMFALLQADQKMYGGADIKIIRDEFARHNIPCTGFPLCNQ